ncbi:MAG: hypothetical protein ABUJ92_00430 [Desulfobacterales bacterium]
MKFKTKAVTINDEEITINEVSGEVRQKLVTLSKSKVDPITFQANVVKYGVEEHSETDVADILKFPSSALQTLSEEIMELSGLTEASDKKAVKNS